jgi:hypothetical protein
MTHLELLQARIAEALENVQDVEDCFDPACTLSTKQFFDLVRERCEGIRDALSGVDDHALTIGNKPDYFCEHGDCRIVAVAGSSWCWPHLAEGRDRCALKGCSCATRDRALICVEHMQEYIAYASRTGKYEMQRWFIARLEVAHGAV